MCPDPAVCRQLCRENGCERGGRVGVAGRRHTTRGHHRTRSSDGASLSPPTFFAAGPGRNGRGALCVGGTRCVWVATRCSPFWDMVVLTATDEKQAESYRLQLEEKQKLKEIPSLK